MSDAGAKKRSELSSERVYHPNYLIAHTARLENFKPMPDGLIRVIDVRLK